MNAVGSCQFWELVEYRAAELNPWILLRGLLIAVCRNGLLSACTC